MVLLSPRLGESTKTIIPRMTIHEMIDVARSTQPSLDFGSTRRSLSLMPGTSELH
jgi:hypothetical protein